MCTIDIIIIIISVYKVISWDFLCRIRHFVQMVALKRLRSSSGFILFVFRAGPAASGRRLSGGAARPQHRVEMFDQDLGEDVDGSQSRQRDRTLTRPNQVHPEHTGQVRRTHLVDDAFLRHLRIHSHKLFTFQTFPCDVKQLKLDYYDH